MTKKNHRPVVVVVAPVALQQKKKEEAPAAASVPLSSSSSLTPISPLALPKKPQPQTSLEKVITRSAIVGNSTVRHVGQILMNGTKFSPHPLVSFSDTAHQSFLLRLTKIFDGRADNPDAESQFLDLLGEYLTQAAGHIPQSGRAGDVPEVLANVKRLMGEFPDGFEEVGRYLLSVARSPVDRF